MRRIALIVALHGVVGSVAAVADTATPVPVSPPPVDAAAIAALPPIRLSNGPTVSQYCALRVRRGEVPFGTKFTVGLIVFVSPQGRIADIRIVQPSANARLDGEAVTCIQRAAKAVVRSEASAAAGEWQRMKWTWAGDP